MDYRVRHTTRYEYDEPVARCHNLAYVLPRNTGRQTCMEARIEVSPEPATVNERVDYFGNRAFHFSIETPHTELEITARSKVHVRDNQGGGQLDIGHTCDEVYAALERQDTAAARLAREFLLPSPQIVPDAALREYAKPFFAGDRPFLSAVRALTQQIYEDFEYDTEFSDVTTPLADVFAHRKGVCQDFAHLAIACVRANGFPARYVSGYLETLPPPGQEKLVGSDASHAWFAVFSPGEGWFEFDPTNDQIASSQHIVTAWGRDYGDVAPLRGVLFGGGESSRLAVAVDVVRSADD